VPTISRPASAWAGLVLILVSMALAACSQDSTLVVYSGRSESLVGPVVDLFRDATGIEVAVKYGGTAEIAATLLEEGKNSPADVFFAQDPGGLGAVVDMLSTLPDDILAPVPPWARSPDGDWVGVSGRARVVAYNTDAVDPSELPDTMEGFADPRWKGRIGWPPSNGSFQAMVTAMRFQWGEERTREWLEGIKANEPVAYPKNTPIVAAAATGEVEVGFVNHYYMHRFLQEEGEGFGARNHYLNGGGPGSVVLVAGAGILETTESRDDAEKFVKFLLSTVAQQYFSAQTFEYPLVDGVAIDSALRPLSELQNSDLDMASLADLKGTQTLLRDLGIIP
jgi:iron(III) transport system substrate-binding protein